MEVNDPWMITFIIIVIISMIGTLGVIIDLYAYHDLTDLNTSLLFLLHFTVFLEDISTLPYVWSSVEGLCEFMGWLHFYSGFANIIVVTLMGFHYLSYLIASYPARINKWISKYGIYITFILPLITLLPFSTDSYGVSNDNWCTLPSHNITSNDWAIAVFYSWVWVLVLVNLTQLSIAVYKVHQQGNIEQVRNNIFYSIGLYIFITFLCWLPRVIPRFLHLFLDYTSSDILYLLTTAPLYLSGIGYTVCYITDFRRNPDRTRSSIKSDGSSLNAEKFADLFRSSSSRVTSENPIFSGSGNSKPVKEGSASIDIL